MEDPPFGMGMGRMKHHLMYGGGSGGACGSGWGWPGRSRGELSIQEPLRYWTASVDSHFRWESDRNSIGIGPVGNIRLEFDRSVFDRSNILDRSKTDRSNSNRMFPTGPIPIEFLSDSQRKCESTDAVQYLSGS